MNKYSIIYSNLSKLKNGLWKPHLYPTNILLDVIFYNNPKGVIVKIGANDGELDDPSSKYLVKYDWKGIFVEPQKYYYNKLESNLQGKGDYYFENLAIGNQRGSFTLYTIDVKTYDSLPPYCGLCSSLDKNYVLKVLKVFDLGEEAIIKETVRVALISDLFKKYLLNNVDILQLDTEGYDGKIINSIDLNYIHPKTIIFEHVNIHFDEYRALCKTLRDANYNLYYWDRDTVALDLSINKLISRPLF